MSEPLEGQMLPNEAPPTWPDLAYWRDLADAREREIERLRQQLDVYERALTRAEDELLRCPPPVVKSDSPKHIVAPFPARALMVWR